MSGPARELVRIGLGLAAVFALTFVLLRLAGVLGVEDIRAWLAAAHQVDPAQGAALVVVLLFADLFVAMPTLTIAILGGHFLGAAWGGTAAVTGMLAAGISGYGLGRRYGTAVLARLYRDERRLVQIQDLFAERGLFVLLVCRALPILPEVSCCLAGATRMPFGRFLAGFCTGTVPFAIIASQAGAASTMQAPMPAIVAFIALPAVSWLCWYFLLLRPRRARRAD